MHSLQVFFCRLFSMLGDWLADLVVLLDVFSEVRYAGTATGFLSLYVLYKWSELFTAASIDLDYTYGLGEYEYFELDIDAENKEGED